MPKTKPFDTYVDRYERWFEKNRFTYESELAAIRVLLPKDGRGVEIGIGTGRFAVPLGIEFGVEPSQAMRAIAQNHGLAVVDGVAEALPFDNAQFDFALMVTTICFLDDTPKAMKEAYRILKPGGSLIIGLVDRDSPMGRKYQRFKSENVFYREATFYSTNEVIAYLKEAGFKDFAFTQTIFQDLLEMREIQPVKEGYGTGSFIAVRGVK